MNDILNVAYNDGADYIVRVNDDTDFVTEGWTSMGVEALLSMDPPNIGVVGPDCPDGNTMILTHDMVHRNHMDIFGGKYYPPVFKNWFLDDWISHVYGSERTRRLLLWQVRHHIEHHGTRYQPFGGEIILHELEKELKMGKAALNEWLLRRKEVHKGGRIR